MGADAGKIGLRKKSMHGTAFGSVIGKNTSTVGPFNFGSSRRICFIVEVIDFQD